MGLLLAISAIVRPSHPRSGGSQVQEMFLAATDYKQFQTTITRSAQSTIFPPPNQHWSLKIQGDDP